MSGGRRGTVYLREEFRADYIRDDNPRWVETLIGYAGHWAPDEEHGDQIEELGLVDTMDEAIEWGRVRANDVLILFEDKGYRWAGVGSGPSDIPPLDTDELD